MKFKLIELQVDFKQKTETIRFAHFNYFYGQMGAGKSSIARMIDYCLGAQLDYTPALQSEFIAATLQVQVGAVSLQLHRERDGHNVRVQWNQDGQFFDMLLPARSSKKEAFPGTPVEVLSDLFFHLNGMHPPKVRRSKIKEESELGRLSFRDLWWYCYLDQEEIDSNFFHLDRDADTFKRLKSRDVLRFVLGYHQEQVAQLEAQLEAVRLQRVALQESAKSLKAALEASEVGTSEQIQQQLQDLQEELTILERQIQQGREEIQKTRSHAADELRKQGQLISHELSGLEQALEDLQELIDDEHRHLFELKTLSVKVRRDAAARAVLGGVNFEACPRCAQSLPVREAGHCTVCGQPEEVIEMGGLDASVIQQDVESRQGELQDVLERHKQKQKELRKQLSVQLQAKVQVDHALNVALQAYDSQYLSTLLEWERSRAQTLQRIQGLQRLAKLPQVVDEQFSKADLLARDEEAIKRELRDAREAAEKDTKNLRRLEWLFLDCLVRARVPGFSTDDKVTIASPYFLPEVTPRGDEGLIVNSFANLGSGGKKTLFKACFALAIHRLAVEVSAVLPTVLIIDSPMKNISERENRLQFEGFHELLYDLAAGELSDTQFILIDKEFLPAPDDFPYSHQVRHMKPNDPVDRPFISYFQVDETAQPNTEAKEPPVQ